MNLKKVFFIVVTNTALILTIIQAAWYFWPPLWETRIIEVDTNWTGIVIMICGATLLLAVINYLLYREKGSDNEAYQIDKWSLASSSVVLVYYVISFLVLPLILLNLVG